MTEQMTEQKVALMTGTSSGFGRLMAETFGRAGYRVFAGMRGTQGKNIEARQHFEGLAKGGSAIEVVELDVTDDAGIEAAVAGILNTAGRIDVLVNNAGMSMATLSECATIEQAKLIFETNYFGPLRLCRAVLPQMRKQGNGFLIYVSSIGGRVALPNSAVYCGTKAAIEMLAEVQRYELASLGIDVSILEPGAYATDIFDKMSYGADTLRMAEYGEIAAKVEQGMAAAKGYLASTQPNPQEVADEALRLAEMAKGERPLRVLLGADAKMLEPINATTGPLTQAMFQAFGFL